MRLVHAIVLLAVTASPAFAQGVPEIVIPGKRGVPVYINGIDASWGIVEGEFGLDRPGAMTPSVVISLGLGLAVLVTLALVDTNLRSQLHPNAGGATPSFYFLDVRSGEIAPCST